MTKKRKKETTKTKENKPLYKKWWFWLVLIIVVGTFGNLADDKEKKATNDSEKDVSTKTEKNDKFKKKKIDLKNNKDMQFEGSNIQPLFAKIDKNGVMTFEFDWRNDWGGGYSGTKSSFNGASLSVTAYQGDEELKSNYEDMLYSKDTNLYFKTEKNVTLTVDYKFNLNNPDSEVTVKIKDLESNEQSFDVDIK